MHNLEQKIPEKLYHELLNNPFIGICITDGKGRVLAVNEAQTRITSIPKENFIGNYMPKMQEEGQLSISSTAEVLRRKEPIYLHQVLSNGRSYDVSALPIYGEENEIEYVISYLLDISDMMDMNQKISKLQEDKKQIEVKYKNMLEALDKTCSIVYQNKQMHQIVELAKKVADTSVTVLITGPSGSGKELIANLLHEQSRRKDMPFIKINCAAIPESLLESELFGYEPGTFTGGNKKGKKGLFEYADGGSLLLDEIGEMPLSLQAKLLRVLQEQEVQRIGGNKPIKINVRLIASTNARLKDLIEEKKFREDLYYRLNVIEIKMPSLKERKEDIPLLAEHFIQVFNTKYHLKKNIESNALQYLSNQHFSGNVRELRNMVERLIFQSAGDIITLSDVFGIFHSIQIHTTTPDFSVQIQADTDVSLKGLVAEYECRILNEYMKIYGSTSVVAQKLKIDRTTISRKLHRQ